MIITYFFEMSFHSKKNNLKMISKTFRKKNKQNKKKMEKKNEKNNKIKHENLK